MSAPSTVAAALASLLDTAPSWLPQVDHWEIAEDTDTWILSGQLAGDMSETAAFRLLAPVIERAPSAHSDDGSLVKVPFEWDGVAGQVWYLRPVERYIVPERCASCPTLLADAGNQFVRLGGPGAPVICVPCRDRMHEAWVREAAVRELGALPMPVGPGPRVDSLPLGVVVELNDLRTRLAGMANPPREVFLAQYEGAEPELFATVEAARACCDDLAKVDAHENYWDWTVNEHGVHVQFWTHPDDDRPLSETSGSVTRVVVQGDEPLSELEGLRARVADLEALTTQATEFRVWESGYGLYVRRAPGATGFAVMEARRTDKGRRVWTTAGWQYSAILSDTELFCWPDAQTAVAEARRIMPGTTVSAEDVTPQVEKLRTLLAGQREQAAEAPHEGPQRHTYRLGRDLPEAGEPS
ncbi:hypothetical protein [Streptomyces sp. NPDC005549]|uniref:hypothetical protein n=1 Tax=Streptomyces sp. NPDC005549 TaxID=3154888 RepID=UPI0033BA8A64